MDTGKNGRQFVNIAFANITPPCLLEQFHVLPKCSNIFDCLVNAMLIIRKLKPSLNVLGIDCYIRTVMTNTKNTLM